MTADFPPGRLAIVLAHRIDELLADDEGNRAVTVEAATTRLHACGDAWAIPAIEDVGPTYDSLLDHFTTVFESGPTRAADELREWAQRLPTDKEREHLWQELQAANIPATYIAAARGTLS